MNLVFLIIWCGSHLVTDKFYLCTFAIFLNFLLALRDLLFNESIAARWHITLYHRVCGKSTDLRRSAEGTCK